MNARCALLGSEVRGCGVRSLHMFGPSQYEPGTSPGSSLATTAAASASRFHACYNKIYNKINETRQVPIESHESGSCVAPWPTWNNRS